MGLAILLSAKSCCRLSLHLLRPVLLGCCQLQLTPSSSLVLLQPPLLCEMRWKNFGETTTEEGRKVFFSGKEDRHEHGVGFLVHKDIVDTVMGCRPVSSRLITIRLRPVPPSITIVPAYAPTSDYDDNEIEEFCDQLQNVIYQTPKKDILVVQ